MEHSVNRRNWRCCAGTRLHAGWIVRCFNLHCAQMADCPRTPRRRMPFCSSSNTPSSRPESRCGQTRISQRRLPAQTGCLRHCSSCAATSRSGGRRRAAADSIAVQWADLALWSAAPTAAATGPLPWLVNYRLWFAPRWARRLDANPVLLRWLHKIVVRALVAAWHDVQANADAQARLVETLDRLPEPLGTAVPQGQPTSSEQRAWAATMWAGGGLTSRSWDGPFAELSMARLQLCCRWMGA